MDSCVKQVAIFIVFASVVVWQGAALGDNNTSSTTTTPTPTPTPTSISKSNSTASNDTSSSPTSIEKLPSSNGDNSGLLQRSLYVAIGISSIVAIYFIVRAMKTRGRRKAKKYGVIHGAGSMEFQPLDKDVDEEEEDMTLFDRKDTRWPK